MRREKSIFFSFALVSFDGEQSQLNHRRGDYSSRPIPSTPLSPSSLCSHLLSHNSPFSQLSQQDLPTSYNQDQTK